MSTIYDNFQVAAAAWEINERLVFHTQAGQMLAGLNYDKEGTLKVEGEDDLPVLQPWAVHFNEELFAGAPNVRSQGRSEANQPVAETLTLTFRVATSRRDGWFRRDPTDTTKRKGLIEWLALIRDAIETPTTGTVPDSRFVGGASKPVTYSIPETKTSQLSFQCSLDVTVMLRPVCRAERSFTMPPN
jgi:hypothetical protein